MRKLTHKEIVEQQLSQVVEPRLPLCVVVNDIRSLHNVGSIFRTCDGLGVEKLWLCGITGYPPQSEISKTALGAEQRVCWEYQKNILAVLKTLKEQHYHIVLLEQTDESVPYEQFRPRSPTCLVIGSEIGGIAEDILPWADTAVEIEMRGIKNSLNVAVAFGVVAYHFRNCLQKQPSQKFLGMIV